MADETRDVAVITGAASGFGRALAELCAARGMQVCVLDIDAERTNETAAAIAETYGVRAVGYRVDVASLVDVEAAETAIGAEFGRCDLLWVNVGVQHFGAVETITDDVWRWVLDVNVVGAARTARTFLPLLRASDHARLAFTSSANALAPAARLGAYQASKYAVTGLAETLAIELAPEITVSVVFPSGMMTRHLESSALARPSELGSGDVDEADLVAMMESRPMTEVDVTTAEAAAESALAGVLAGEPYVMTHGDLAAPVAARHAAISKAVDRLATPTDG